MKIAEIVRSDGVAIYFSHSRRHLTRYCAEAFIIHSVLYNYIYLYLCDAKKGTFAVVRQLATIDDK